MRADRFPYDCWLAAGQLAGASSGAFFERRVYERRVAGCCFSWRTNDVRLICFHDVPTAALNETLHNADAEPLCPLVNTKKTG
jgi:hypothetical protein